MFTMTLKGAKFKRNVVHIDTFLRPYYDVGNTDYTK